MERLPKLWTGRCEYYTCQREWLPKLWSGRCEYSACQREWLPKLWTGRYEYSACQREWLLKLWTICLSKNNCWSCEMGWYKHSACQRKAGGDVNTLPVKGNDPNAVIWEMWILCLSQGMTAEALNCRRCEYSACQREWLLKLWKLCLSKNNCRVPRLWTTEMWTLRMSEKDWRIPLCLSDKDRRSCKNSVRDNWWGFELGRCEHFSCRKKTGGAVNTLPVNE